MEVNQLLIISLVSSKTKNLVSSLKLKPSGVNICISRSIYLFVFIGNAPLVLDFYKDSNNQNELLPTDITLPVSVYVGYQNTKIQLSTPLLSFSKWLNHIKTVFCCTQPPCLQFFEGWEKFGIESLKEALGSFKTIVARLLTNNSSRRLLKLFDSPRELILDNNPFEEACQIHQIFLQNFEYIEFGGVHSLDDMLLVNSKIVELYHSISQKQFNHFLKHWIRGSSPRLQYMALSIDMTDFVNGEVYLKGIRCMEMSEDAKMDMCRKRGLSVPAHMVQIKRKDGTPAVIGTADSENTLNIYFFVLN